MSLISTVLAFSFAAMITHTNQAVLLPDMVVAMLLTAMVSALLVAWKGSMAGLIGIPLPSAAAMFADMLQGINPSIEQFWLLLMLNGLMTASFMLLMGSLKLSRIVRYLPLPVLAGFLAGIGWLFIKGGLALTGLTNLAVNQLQDSSLWMALSFAFILWLLRQRIQPAHLLPLATLIGGIIMVLLAPFLQNQASWFFQLETSGSLPLTSYQWLKNGVPSIDWVYLPWSALLTLASISVLSMLLQATSIELLAKQDLNLDHELKLAGSMNLITALLGGGIASLSLSQTSMVRQMQANYRITGVLIALLLLLVIFIHEHLLRWLPLPLVAGLLVFQGMQF
ncbi:MAG: SulP family inorganic anion transporter, partial [Pseudomonadaceae bacterium]|nr:SulP family inorganic anion transporter [Pseudomonadaceae bacterium]